MKAWITKYALTEGIIEADATVITEGNAISVHFNGNLFANYFYGKDWHVTKDAAVLRAEEMRDRQIASLKKQIEKLEKMRFGD